MEMDYLSGRDYEIVTRISNQLTIARALLLSTLAGASYEQIEDAIAEIRLALNDLEALSQRHTAKVIRQKLEET